MRLIVFFWLMVSAGWSQAPTPGPYQGLTKFTALIVRDYISASSATASFNSLVVGPGGCIGCGGSGSGASPSTPLSSVQFNNGGSFGGSAGLTYVTATSTLIASTISSSVYNGGTFNGNGSGLSSVAAASVPWSGISGIPGPVQAVSNGTPISVTGLTVAGTLSGSSLISSSAGGVVSGTYGYFGFVSGTLSGNGAGITGVTANAISWTSILGIPAGITNISNSTGSVTVTSIAATMVSATGATGTVTATYGYFGNISGSGAGITGVVVSSVSWTAIVGIPAGISNISNSSGGITLTTVTSGLASATTTSGTFGYFGFVSGTLAGNGVAITNVNAATAQAVSWTNVTNQPAGIANVSNSTGGITLTTVTAGLLSGTTTSGTYGYFNFVSGTTVTMINGVFTNVAGTISTPAQPNITSLAQLTGLTVSGTTSLTNVVNITGLLQVTSGTATVTATNIYGRNISGTSAFINALTVGSCGGCSGAASPGGPSGSIQFNLAGSSISGSANFVTVNNQIGIGIGTPNAALDVNGVVSGTAFAGPVVAGPPFANLVVRTDNISTSQFVDISADVVVGTNSSGQVKRVTSVSVRLDNTLIGAGGMDTGTTSSTSTWYNAYIISGVSGTSGVITSGTTPILPAGYTFSQRVAAVRTDASANKYFLKTVQRARRASYVVQTATNTASMPLLTSGSSGNVSTPTYTATSVSNFVPPTATDIQLVGGLGVTFMLAPNTSYGAFNSSANPPPCIWSGTSDNKECNFTLENTNIGYASNQASVKVLVRGWEDNL